MTAHGTLPAELRFPIRKLGCIVFRTRLVAGLGCLLLTLTAKAQDGASGTALQQGMKYTGLLFSYTNSKSENQSSLLENTLSNKKTDFSLRLGGGYLIRPQMALGMGVSLGNLRSDKIVKNTFGPNTQATVHTRELGVFPNIRNYLRLDKTHHFYLYTQTGLLFSFENGKETSATGATIENSTIRNKKFGLAFAPGLLAFINKGFAFEVNVGVGGINYTDEKKITEGKPVSRIRSTTVDLNINLLRLNLGVAYYFR